MAHGPLDQLHPALREWFQARFPYLTDIQDRALRYTLFRQNALILAPTGSGKTFFSLLVRTVGLATLASQNALPNAVCAVYVSPLKSLGRDIHRNLEEPLAAINGALPEKSRIRMEVRTGDTEGSERGRQQRRRPHLLLTTPESLSALLSQKGWADGFDTRTCDCR